MAGRWTKGLGEAGIPALVHDYLETHYGDRFTINAIVGIVQLYDPEARPATIRRSVCRLVERGMILTEPVPDANNGALWYYLPDRAYLEEAAG